MIVGPPRGWTPTIGAVDTRLDVIDLGRMAYAEAYEAQRAHHAEIRAAREAGTPVPGRVLVVEHDPVVTISRKAAAGSNLLASPELLARHGVGTAPTNRGGDITYHGPGQIVVYPIVDLRTLDLRLHEYLRTLEGAIIACLGSFGVGAVRDADATGVWIPNDAGEPERKIAAIGVRVERWVTLHGLALNVRANLDHFRLIVPCGLVGRAVTSLDREMGEACPSTGAVRTRLCDAVVEGLTAKLGAV